MRLSETVASRSLEIEVADFGPITEAKVELRPLTVFVGPSDTGKSYLTILIYALHCLCSRFANPFGGPRGRPTPALAYLAGQGGPGCRDGTDLPDESVSALSALAVSLADASKASDQGRIVLPPAVAGPLRSAFQELANACVPEINRCFGIHEHRPLIRHGSAGRSRIVLRSRLHDPATVIEQTISLASSPTFRLVVPTGVKLPVDFKAWDGAEQWLHDIVAWQKIGPRFAASQVLAWLYDMLLPGLVGPLLSPAFYLPAGRSGIMHAHSVVVSALIASTSGAGLIPAPRTPMLSGVLADFLQQLIDIAPVEQSGSHDELNLGRDLENILAGSVRVDRSSHVSYPRFTFRPHGWTDDLVLTNASSMIAELAPVVLYLRHLIAPGNVLLVEEPEAHLHPAMQVEITRQLVGLVKAGVRVIVTTHSEWLLEELANIVRRSQVTEAERGDAPVLRPEHVGAWLFAAGQDPTGTTVKEVPLDDTGLYPSGYDEVAVALHNDWAAITSRIEGDS